MTEEVALTPEQALAADLLEIGWRSVDWDTWGKYRLTVWDQFTDRVRLAATTTSSLPRFWASLSQQMGIGQVRDHEEREALGGILTSGQDRALLRLLRQETDLLVLVVRLRSEGRKAAYEARRAQEESQQEALAL